MKTTFLSSGNYYHGNFHAHTTCSDGELTPEETVRAYREKGYDFIAITDHNKWGARCELGDDRFLVIPGTEIDSVYEGGVHHIVGVGGNLPDGTVIPGEFRRNVHPQVMIDYLNSIGCTVIYAHPFWSYCDLALLASLRGLTGMEIINYSCEQEWKSGISEVYFDYLWRNAESRTWAFGADDAHGHVPDYFGGSITVKAASLTQAAIFDAIRAGSFYASYTPDGCPAPHLEEFYVDDTGTAHVTCSPCRNIYLIVSRVKYHPLHGTPDSPITEHSWKLPEGAAQVKCVLTDFNGAITWSQPIVL